MKIIYNKIFLEHNTGNHPENKNRLSPFFHLPDSEIKNGEEFLTLAHSKKYIDYVKDVCEKGMQLEDDYDTVVSKRSYEAACYATGAAVQAAEEQAFAIVRPPGHHAERNNSGGFCLFNNMAIATKYLLNQGKRVFIIDFDVHHGNSTEEILLGEKNVIYFSTHQSGAYPGTGNYSRDNCIDVPLRIGTGDEEYINTLELMLAPAIENFKPDIIGVSAGFDSYFKDYGFMNQFVGFKLTEKSYLKIIELIKPYKVFCVLEGGYNPVSIKEGVDLFVKNL